MTIEDAEVWHWTPGGMHLGHDCGEDHYILVDEVKFLLEQAQCQGRKQALEMLKEQNELLRKRIAEQATDWKRDDLLPSLLRRQAE